MAEPINVTVTALNESVQVTGSSSGSVQITNGGGVDVKFGTVAVGDSLITAGTVSVGKVATLAPGSNATVTNSGTSIAAVLDFGIPTGNAGPTGPAGKDGLTPSINIGQVTTLAAGGSATVTATPSNGGANVTLDFGIPRGDPGTGGSNGAALSDADPSALGTAAAGSSNQASRADHVHELPSLSTLGAAAANHGHNYITSLNNLTGALTLAAGGNVTLTANGSTLTISAAGGLGENDAVDGGLYAGEILYGITFTTQPQSQSLNSSTTVGNWVAQNVGAHTGLLATNGTGFLSVGTTASVSGANVSSLVSTSSDGASWSNTTDSTTANLGISFAASNTLPVSSPRWDGSQYVYAVNPASHILAVTRQPSGNLTVVSAVTAAREDDPLVDLFCGGGTYVLSSLLGYRRSVDYTSWTTLSAWPSSPYGATTKGEWWQSRFIAASLRRNLNFTTGLYGAIGFYVYSSTDAGSWTTVHSVPFSSPDYSSLEPSVAVSPTVAIAGYSGGTSYLYRSTNGTTWSAVTLPRTISRVFWAGTRFVALVAGSSYEYCWSTDGLSWSVASLPSTRVWASAAGTANTIAVSGYNADLRAASVGTVAASANLTVSAIASSGNPVSYQWQSSLDAGASWSNVANATNSALNLTGLTQADNGTRYRALASATGATSVNSQSATLTVTG